MKRGIELIEDSWILVFWFPDYLGTLGDQWRSGDVRKVIDDG